MANPNFTLIQVQRDSSDEELILATFCNGGPITVSVDYGNDDGEEPETKSYTFNADPFFRRNNHYIASGIVTLRPGGKTLIIAVSFVNMFPKGEDSAKEYNLQLLPSTAFVDNVAPPFPPPPEPTPPEPTPPKPPAYKSVEALVNKKGTLPFQESHNIILRVLPKSTST
jgi:hypothetical protein